MVDERYLEKNYLVGLFFLLLLFLFLQSQPSLRNSFLARVVDVFDDFTFEICNGDAFKVFMPKTVTSQQTQYICITVVQRRPNIFDVGPILYKCYTNVLRLLGSSFIHEHWLRLIMTDQQSVAVRHLSFLVQIDKIRRDQSISCS